MCLKLLEVCHNKNSFGLQPTHYYTAPGLAWSAMLKKNDKTEFGIHQRYRYGFNDREG